MIKSLNSKLSLLIILLGLGFSSISSAQDSNLGNWIIYFGNKQLNEKWNIHHEVQYRNYNAIGDLEQLLLRTGLGYTFNNGKSNLLLGYGYILSENYIGDDDKISINEHRIYQQFISKQNVGKLSMQHRYRFEQRLVESDFRMRLRYFLGLNYPLTKNEEDPEDFDFFYLSAYNEIFLNTESSVFDRNRVYGGLGYRLNKDIRFELGYMTQLFENGSRDQLNMIMFLNF